MIPRRIATNAPGDSRDWYLVFFKLSIFAKGSLHTSSTTHGNPNFNDHLIAASWIYNQVFTGWLDTVHAKISCMQHEIVPATLDRYLRSKGRCYTFIAHRTLNPLR